MMVRTKQVVAIGLLAGVLAGCGLVQKATPKKGYWFDGHQFRVRAEKVGDEREEVLVTVSRASQSAIGAIEAGRHGAVRYCIENFGRSDIDWAEGQSPDDENAKQRITEDQVTFRGRCKAW